MEIRAYDEMYLSSAQNILGHAVDFAVMTLEIEPNVFGKALAFSRSAKQFSSGNPRYVAGVNGCEFAREVLDEYGITYKDVDDIMYMDKSPEYWAGWAVAFYQWYMDVSFSEIFNVVTLDEIIAMYPVYHEMDIMQFVDRMNELMRDAYTHTKLYKHRKNNGLSQEGLSRESGVPLRQIQLFEQRQRDINKTSSATLYKLSKVLHCSMEDLMDPSYAFNELKRC
ncbi:MAG: helix-turn-helix domain-containing protein [Oribacterium sp.]|nr:helix-turn-helix domain-containing protein [Oribacterium sp.]